MAQTREGAIKIAASRVGISLAEYKARLDTGEKWCTGCKAWHDRTAFNRDGSRRDGLKARCRAFDKRLYDATYKPVPLAERRSSGPPPAPARDGDVKQARKRVNLHVRTGRWPHPNSLPCVECGHAWAEGERRHEYDHHLGYAAEHHESVEVVCTTCHHLREQARVA